MKGKYPVNVILCEHEGCTSTDTTPCVLTMYRRDLPVIWYIRTYGLYLGLQMTWHLWREGWVELPPHWYCIEHAYKEGFCWGCGQFWSGSDYEFDFLGDRLCPNCRESEDEDDDDYDWWEGEDWYG